MVDKAESLIEQLNVGNAKERLSALETLVKDGLLPKVNRRENDANNHIHTIYSFSPYSPTMAAYKAYLAGLTSAGIMDHDSLSGAKEFKKACKLLNLGSTVGVELRTKFVRDGILNTNNPDQANCAYVACHGIPEKSVDKFNEYLEGIREKRFIRDKKMCEKISETTKKHGFYLDLEKDVLPLSRFDEGGTVTERHVLFALANKLGKHFGQSDQLIDFLTEGLKFTVSEKQKNLLLDKNNPHFAYDLLGILKQNNDFFYVEADEELPLLEDYIKVATSFGGFVAYAYLGDVESSVTGDKKVQKFEDDFLDDLIEEIAKIGIKAVAYMPTRNTPAQLSRLRTLCKKHGLFEISGEDINSPRQKFECEALKNPTYSNLITSTWALIGHESEKEKGRSGLFDKETVAMLPDLDERVEHFAKIGRKTV